MIPVALYFQLWAESATRIFNCTCSGPASAWLTTLLPSVTIVSPWLMCHRVGAGSQVPVMLLVWPPLPPSRPPPSSQMLALWLLERLLCPQQSSHFSDLFPENPSTSSSKWNLALAWIFLFLLPPQIRTRLTLYSLWSENYTSLLTVLPCHF